MSRRIIILEEEKRRILDLHKTYGYALNEQATNDGKLWEKYPCVTKNSSAKKEDLGNGYSRYVIGNEMFYNNGRKQKTDGTMVSYFCNGTNISTTQQKVSNTVNKSVKLPNLTYKNFCELPGDKNWVYAKLDDGTWYTSKATSKVDWFKLELPKYKKAVDLLTKDAKCSGLEEISVLAVKQAEEINQTPDNTQTTTDNNQPNLNPSTTTPGYQPKTDSELLPNTLQQKNTLQSSSLR